MSHHCCHMSRGPRVSHHCSFFFCRHSEVHERAMGEASDEYHMEAAAYQEERRLREELQSSQDRPMEQQLPAELEE
eukprot:12538644-Prorocentrum_lima.AAC.1